MNRLFSFYVFILTIVTVSCTSKLPTHSESLDVIPAIYPDYTDLVIPCNISPLNFKINEEGDEFISVVQSRKGEKLLSAGKKTDWNLKKWQRLLQDNKGDTLFTDVYVKRNGQWHKYSAVKNYIASEEIDPYISYRLIEPSYRVYEYMTINQRNLTNFDETTIFNNTQALNDETGYCINCHSYQDYNKEGKMQFHIRQHLGGTVIVSPDGVKKVNLKTDSTLSAGVYPAWHPVKNVIAYSVNQTEQYFLPAGVQKVEVMDRKSDLILYDVDKNEVHAVSCDSRQLETFPAWSPDGKFLYYAAARCPEGADLEAESILAEHTKLHYDIYRKAFDAETLTFSASDTVFKASEQNKSATFPRISPDGRYMLFTLGNFGNFHIWHKDSDLYLLDLSTGMVRPMIEMNSPDVESYHSWSSNGAWIIFSSRRDDGSYTRPYISYFKDGKGSKPFVLPQKDPDFYGSLFKSYNIPEFMIKPVTVSRRKLLRAISKSPEDAFFVSFH